MADRDAVARAGRAIDTDPALAERLAYCVPLGIPHSVLLGRDPVAEGPPWTSDDLELALAWRRLQAECCPQCGTRRRDWFDATTGEPLEEPAVAVALQRCAGCEAAAHAADGIAKSERGMHVQFLPLEMVKAQAQAHAREERVLRLVERGNAASDPDAEA